jgi:uncharacterized protein (TIGR02466 family)
MPDITSLFVTRLYRAGLNDLAKKKVDYAELRQTCDMVAEDDEAGQEWCEANGYPGYTSYASLNDLPWRMPIFGDLEKALDKHVAAFCKDLGFDLGDKKLKCNSLWINILPEGGTHASHIHPHSVISGTTYVAMPEGTSRAEAGGPPPADDDAGPRPPENRAARAAALRLRQPAVGEVLLWESWLRHEVPMNMSEEERISVSFNYGWA